MEPRVFEYAYSSLDEVRRVTPQLAEILEDQGVPLDHVVLFNGRVAMLRDFDYEEGRARPLVQRSYVWPVLRRAFDDYLDGVPHTAQQLVVNRHGMPHWT
jgi:hypothetical protein